MDEPIDFDNLREYGTLYPTEEQVMEPYRALAKHVNPEGAKRLAAAIRASLGTVEELGSILTRR